MHRRILPRVREAIPEVEVLQHVHHVQILFSLTKSSWLLVIREATNHGEAVEHVGVGEIVDIEGELEGDQAQAVPRIYMHRIVGRTCHHNLRHGGHQDRRALHVMYLRVRSMTERRGLKRPAVSEGTEEGSTASGSQSKKRKHRGKRDKRIDEARNHCRIVLLDWFRK